MADLEEPHARAAVAAVVRHRLEQAGPQRGAQHRLLGRERVGEDEASRVEPARLEVAGGQERHRQ